MMRWSTQTPAAGGYPNGLRCNRTTIRSLIGTNSNCATIADRWADVAIDKIFGQDHSGRVG